MLAVHQDKQKSPVLWVRHHLYDQSVKSEVVQQPLDPLNFSASWGQEQVDHDLNNLPNPCHRLCRLEPFRLRDKSNKNPVQNFSARIRRSSGSYTIDWLTKADCLITPGKSLTGFWRGRRAGMNLSFEGRGVDVRGGKCTHITIDLFRNSNRNEPSLRFAGSVLKGLITWFLVLLVCVLSCWWASTSEQGVRACYETAPAAALISHHVVWIMVSLTEGGRYQRTWGLSVKNKPLLIAVNRLQ